MKKNMICKLSIFLIASTVCCTSCTNVTKKGDENATAKETQFTATPDVSPTTDAIPENTVQPSPEQTTTSSSEQEKQARGEQITPCMTKETVLEKLSNYLPSTVMEHTKEKAIFEENILTDEEEPRKMYHWTEFKSGTSGETLFMIDVIFQVDGKINNYYFKYYDDSIFPDESTRIDKDQSYTMAKAFAEDFITDDEIVNLTYIEDTTGHYTSENTAIWLAQTNSQTYRIVVNLYSGYVERFGIWEE